MNIGRVWSLVCYLVLAWNLEIQMRLGHFGWAMVAKKALRLEKVYKQNKRPSDGRVTSCRFVCANECRAQDKMDYLTKCPWAETRTNCQVHMNLIMDRKKEVMKVSGLILEHNHTLHLQETLHLMVSQRKISEVQAFEIETGDDAGIGPKAAHLIFRDHWTMMFLLSGEVLWFSVHFASIYFASNELGASFCKQAFGKYSIL